MERNVFGTQLHGKLRVLVEVPRGIVAPLEGSNLSRPLRCYALRLLARFTLAQI